MLFALFSEIFHFSENQIVPFKFPQYCIKAKICSHALSNVKSYIFKLKIGLCNFKKNKNQYITHNSVMNIVAQLHNYSHGEKEEFE
jgi:hypothetical protein